MITLTTHHSPLTTHHSPLTTHHSPLTTHHKAHRGFSLIEAAIVLGVVGLVIGGIWVAAAAVSYHYQEQQFYQGFITQKRNVETYLTQSLSCSSTMLAGVSGSYVKYSSPTIFNLLNPPEWKNIDIAGFCHWSCEVTNIACDASGVRYYAVFLEPPGGSKTTCLRVFNYLRARGYLVGWGGVMGANNCNSASYRGFNVFYEIPRRS